jgi:adenine-specific DNA-methyltransferase
MNEVFGEENFLACVCWQKRYAPSNDTVDFSPTHDYILVYGRIRPFSDTGKILPLLDKLSRTEEQNKMYRNPDNDPRGAWRADNYLCNKTAEQRPNLYYPIINPNTGEEIWPNRTAVWRYSKDRHEKNAKDGRVWWGQNGNNSVPAYKRFLNEVGGRIPDTWWQYNDVGHNDEAKKQIKDLFPEASSVFDTPKPTRLIKRMLELATDPGENDIVLDFFAGSATTAHAVISLNKEDEGNRRFVCVQLPEKIVESTQQVTFKTIADIGKERIRRAIAKLKADTLKSNEQSDLFPSTESTPDLGFKVFKLRESNFRTWRGDLAETEAELVAQLDMFVDTLRPEAQEENVAYELMLKTGFELTTSLKRESQGEANYWSINNGEVLLLLSSINEDLIDAVIATRPQKVICLDSLFHGDDQLKTNTALAMKDAGIPFEVV